MGIAIQLCGLRFPGRRLTDLLPIPAVILNHIAGQLGIAPERFEEYGQRRPTIYAHLDHIRQAYGYRDYGSSDLLPLTRYLLPLTMESDEPLPLVQAALHYLRAHRIIAPGITTTESLVWRVQRIARRRVYARLTRPLAPSQQAALDALVATADSPFATSPFAWLRLPVGNPTPAGMYHLLDRLAYIHDLRLPSPPTTVHPHRLRELAEQARRYKAQQVGQFEAHRRRAYLVAYVYALTAQLTDQLLDMFGRVFADLLRRGRNAQKHQLYRSVATLNRVLNTLTSVAEAFLAAREAGTDPVAAMLAVADEATLQATVEVAKAHMRPASLDYRDLLENRYRYRRQAFLDMYRTLSFVPVNPEHPALAALAHAILLLDTYKQRVTAVQQTIGSQVFPAPLAHLAHTRWRRHAVQADGTINPNFYEMGAWHRLREGLRAGDIAVPGSHRYRAFDDCLLPIPAWEALKEQGNTRLAVGADPEIYLAERQSVIAQRLAQLPQLLAEEGPLSVDDDGALHLAALPKSTPDEVQAWGRLCYRVVPEVQLADLIVGEIRNTSEKYPLAGELPIP